MAEQDLILGKNKNKKQGRTFSYMKGIDPPKKDPNAHIKRRDNDEEELRGLLVDLIRTEIKNLFVKK